MNPTPPPALSPHPAATFIPYHRPNLLPPPPPPPSLPNALADLSSLIDLSTTALRSLPTPIQAATSTAAASFVACPFNPNHRLPPSALFSHYLNCPSPLSLPHSFQYPLTLHSSSSTTAAAPPTVTEESCEITVSLEEYISYNAPANKFFYQSCPGPVTPSIPPPSSINLPRILYTECAEFNREPPPEASEDVSLDFIRFLPSEIWAIRSEIESWGGGFPTLYSSRILRAILRLRDCNLLHLYDWIIANSPRYGVIIDCAMRDHVVLLVKLCLKVIIREALKLAGVSLTHVEMKNVLCGLGNRSFECPGLVKAMEWLALQLSLLYGEGHGKYLAVDVVKECIKDSASRASLFALAGKDDGLNDGENIDRNVEEQVQSVLSIGNTEGDDRESIEREAVGTSIIFISQVAAAVAALHERYLIEEKIKALRNARPLSAYQRNIEHAHVSKIADEERKKRPDYRPVVEYDGFLRHRSNNQDANRVKTKEELLAEERDYKRRRMSYRGKKLKRNPVEIIRDIIEENMEEMRQAGGFGGPSNAVDETESLASENVDRHASATNDSGSRRSSEVPEENRGRSVDYRKDIHSRHYSGDFKNDNRQPRQDANWDHERQYPNRSIEGILYGRDEDSAPQDGRKISNHSREQVHGREKTKFVEAFAEDSSHRSHQRQSESQDMKYYKSNRDEHEQKTERRRDDHEKKTHRRRNKHEQKTDRRRRDEHERSSRKRERDEDNWEYEDRDRSKRGRASRDRYEDKGERAERRKSKTNSHRELHEFDDRYDPSVSHDLYEDDY